MGRRNRSVTEMDELIASYLKRRASITKQEFCNEVKVSPSCFYRHLARYQSGKEPVSHKVKAKQQSQLGNFIELNPKAAKHSGKTSYRVILRFLGLKLFRLELENV